MICNYERVSVSSRDLWFRHRAIFAVAHALNDIIPNAGVRQFRAYPLRTYCVRNRRLVAAAAVRSLCSHSERAKMMMPTKSCIFSFSCFANVQFLDGSRHVTAVLLPPKC